MNVMNNSGKARCPLGYKCPDKVKFHNITSKAYREHKALANKQKKGNKNKKNNKNSQGSPLDDFNTGNNQQEQQKEQEKTNFHGNKENIKHSEELIEALQKLAKENKKIEEINIYEDSIDVVTKNGVKHFEHVEPEYEGEEATYTMYTFNGETKEVELEDEGMSEEDIYESLVDDISPGAMAVAGGLAAGIAYKYAQRKARREMRRRMYKMRRGMNGGKAKAPQSVERWMQKYFKLFPE